MQEEGPPIKEEGLTSESGAMLEHEDDVVPQSGERGDDRTAGADVIAETSGDYAPRDSAQQVQLADKYYLGDGVPIDHRKALTLYLLAGQAGNTQALINAAKMYDNGDGTTQSADAASEIYLNAAELGDPIAQNKIAIRLTEGQGIKKNPKEAIKWFSRAADQGFADAQYNLGIIYFNGDGTPKDLREAHRLIRKAADGGNVDALYWLGQMYSAGNGVGQDMNQAIEWLEKAANRGHPKAKEPLAALKAFQSQMNGGSMEAMFRQAAAGGDRTAMYNLGVMYDQGKGAKQDKREARYWYKKAAQANLSQAQQNLGVMLMRGEGGPKDLVMAYVWLRIANDNGSARAGDPLEYLSETLSNSELKRARSLAEQVKRQIRDGAFPAE